MNLDWTTERVGGVVLVAVRLRNDTGLDREVRLRNELDGPVLPPRREGVFEAGWDRAGVTLVVENAATEALGYACPVIDSRDDQEPPVRIASVREPDSASGHLDAESVAVPAGRESDGVARAVRSLGDPRPPRAVLGASRALEYTPSGETAMTTRDVPETGVSETAGTAADGADAAAEGEEATEDEEAVETEHDGTRASAAAGESPPVAADWSEAVRHRVAVVESLRGASVAEATAMLDRHGGIEGVEAIVEQLDADAAKLRSTAGAGDALVDRVATAEAPVETLRRLA